MSTGNPTFIEKNGEHPNIAGGRILRKILKEVVKKTLNDQTYFDAIGAILKALNQNNRILLLAGISSFKVQMIIYNIYIKFFEQEFNDLSNIL